MAHVADILTGRRPYLGILPPDRRVIEAIQMMVRRELGAILVARDRDLIGILTKRDVVHRVVAQGHPPSHVSVETVMTRSPVTVEAEEDVREAVTKMRRARCRHLPVMIDGQVVDTLSISDLLSVELHDREHEVEQLAGYIRGERSF